MSKSKIAPQLLMPKATAIWFLENTALTFEQIADFTGHQSIEISAAADEEIWRGIVGRDPVAHHELDPNELEKAKADPAYRMAMKRERTDLPAVKQRAKGPKYTPVSKRGDKPDAISWILKHHPEISDAQIVKLVGTTKPTITAIRDRTHANISNIRPRHPVELGLCTYTELEKASDKGLRAQGKDPEAVKAERAEQQKSAEPAQPEPSSKADDFMSGFDFSNFIGKSGTGD